MFILLSHRQIIFSFDCKDTQKKRPDQIKSKKNGVTVLLTTLYAITNSFLSR